MSGIGSLGAKGEKNKGKFTSININSIYRGATAAPPKSTASTTRHGLQSLGKVGGVRRMPPPIHLPSLKSENSGNDQNVNLVPSGGSGWVPKEDEEGHVQQQQQHQPQPQQPQPQQPQLGTRDPVNKQSVTPEIYDSGAPFEEKKSVPTSAQENISKPSHILSTSTVTQAVITTAAQSSQVGTASANISSQKSWSGIAAGKKKQDVVDQNSPLFQEEFPSLASGEEKSESVDKDDKESQYGPGPSLRPQNVGSWRDGGSRGSSHFPPDEGKSEKLHSAEAGFADREESQHMPMTMPSGPRPNIPPMGPNGPRMFMGMIPPYMFPGRPGFTPGPPHFGPPLHAGVRAPYPFPGGDRFRPPVPTQKHAQNTSSEEKENVLKKASIIKDKDLKEFDNLLSKDADGGWAQAEGEIDYNEKLVFSDEEEEPKSQSRRPRTASERSKGSSDCDSRDEINRELDNRPKMDKAPIGPREAWVGNSQGSFAGGRPPLDQAQWHRMPFDPRAPHQFPHPGFRMMQPGHGGMPPRHQYMNQMGLVRHPAEIHRSMEGPMMEENIDHDAKDSSKIEVNEDIEDEVWRQRHKKKIEISESLEKARIRREEEERRVELERKAGAAEKLRQLEQRMAAKKEDSVDKEETEVDSEETRTTSQPEKRSENERKYHRESKHVPNTKLPPRLQRQAMLDRNEVRQQQSPPHPVAPPHGIRGPPPPPWHPYWQMWGVRPPIDMQGWEEAMRRGQHPRPYFPGYPMNFEGPDPSFEQEDKNNSNEDVENVENSEQGKNDLPHETIKSEEKTDDRHRQENIDMNKTENLDTDSLPEPSSYNWAEETNFEDEDHVNVKDSGVNSDLKVSKNEKLKGREDMGIHSSAGASMHPPFRRLEQNKSRKGDWHAPPPIPTQQAQQNLPPRSNYTSLKRSYSNATETASEKISTKVEVQEARVDTSALNAVQESTKSSNVEPGKVVHSAGDSVKADELKNRDVENRATSTGVEHHIEDVKQKLPQEKNDGKKGASQDIRHDKKEDKKKRDSDKSSRTPRGGKEGEGQSNRGKANSSSRGRTESSRGREYVRGGGGRGRGSRVQSGFSSRGGFNYPTRGTRSRQSRGGRFDNRGPKDEFQFKSQGDSGHLEDEYVDIEPKKRTHGEELDGSFDSLGVNQISESSEKSHMTLSNEWSSDGKVTQGEQKHVKSAWGPPPQKETPTDSKNDLGDPLRETRKATPSVWGEPPQRDPKTEKANKVPPKKMTPSGEKPKPVIAGAATMKQKPCTQTKSPMEPKDMSRSKDKSSTGEIEEEEMKKMEQERRGRHPRDHQDFKNRPNASGRGQRNQGPTTVRNKSNNYRGSRNSEMGEMRTTNVDQRERGPARGARGVARGRGNNVRNSVSVRNPKQSMPSSQLSDGRDQRVPSSAQTNKKDWKSSPPPRFQGRGGLSARRDPEVAPEAGRGRGRGAIAKNSEAVQQPRVAANIGGGPKKSISKQNSSDIGNEEWETASESSDVLQVNDLSKTSEVDSQDKGAQQGYDPKEKQLKQVDQELPANHGRKGKEKLPTNSSHGNAPRRRDRNSNRPMSGNRKENVDVYRVDEVVLQNPVALENALNTVSKGNNRKSDGEMSKSNKAVEKEKKDALANIDINNYAGVVVIDDQPEVTIDDPAFLFENNEGFQEVTSRKNAKLKKVTEDIKKIDAPPPAKQAKKEPSSKASKSRGVSSAEQKRLNKLPPRLAKQREQSLKEKKHKPSALPPTDNINESTTNFVAANLARVDDSFQIENWDNEMANNIPIQRDESMQNTQAISRTLQDGPFSAGMHLPAPAPPVNAWDKPINLVVTSCVSIASALSNQQLSIGQDKPDANNGIDLTENVITSSDRSSPNSEKKRKNSLQGSGEKGTVKALPPRLAKDANLGKKPEVHKQQSSHMRQMEPIQLPARYDKDPFKFKNEDASDLKLEFTFDPSFDPEKLTEDEHDDNQAHENSKQQLHGNHSNSTNNLSDIASPATDEQQIIDQKVASVKNLWESSSTLYEHSNTMTSANSASLISSTSAVVSVVSESLNDSPSSIATSTPLSQTQDAIGSSPSQSRYSNFTKVGESTSAEMSSHREHVNTSVSQSSTTERVISEMRNSPQDHMQEMSSLSYVDHSNKRATHPTVTEQNTNVCKVRPQQQLPQQQIGNSPVAQMLNVAGIASPPAPTAQQVSQVIIAAAAQQMSQQYHPFQLNSQILPPSGPPQESQRNFPQQNYFGVNHSPATAPAPPTGTQIAAQQPPPPPQNYNQHNLFLPPSANSAPGQTSELYSSNPLPPFRNQVGQSPQNIMATSANSSLVSAAIKPPTAPSQLQNQFVSGSGQKGNPLGTTMYGQMLNSIPLQASQLFVSYDPGQPLSQSQAPQQGQHSITGANQTGSLIGSQLMQPQPQVANVPSGPSRSSFFSHQSLQQPPQQSTTGFYQAQQQTNSNITAPIHQVTAAQTQYAIHGFNQPSGLGMQTPPVSLQSASSITNQTTLNKSAPPFKPSAQQHLTSQQQAINQVKSPRFSAGGNNVNQTSMFPLANSGTNPSGNNSGIGGLVQHSLGTSNNNSTFQSNAIAANAAMLAAVVSLASGGMQQQSSHNLASFMNPFNTNQQMSKSGSAPNSNPQFRGNFPDRSKSNHKQPPVQMQQPQQFANSSTKVNPSFISQQNSNPQNVQGGNGNMLRAQLLAGITGGRNNQQQPYTAQQPMSSNVGNAHNRNRPPQFSQSAAVSSNSSHKYDSSLKQMQAKQREELLKHAHTFLNPTDQTPSTPVAKISDIKEEAKSAVLPGTKDVSNVDMKET